MGWRGRTIGAVVTLLLAAAGCVNDRNETLRGPEFDGMWNMATLPPPAQYGNVLISRLTRSSTHPPVAFSHWVHRRLYTCRVCHFELNFALKTNTTEISEAKIRKGEYCGACHNDKTAFGITEVIRVPAAAELEADRPAAYRISSLDNFRPIVSSAGPEDTCTICHTGDIGASDGRFEELKDFPPAPYGNKIDWVMALERGFIAPKQSILDENYQPIPFEEELKLDSEWRLARTWAVFPHQKHIAWLDCADCHPDIFSIQKKGTRNMRMDTINRGMFCGSCHGSVAFPLQDCKRCHPGLR